MKRVLSFAAAVGLLCTTVALAEGIKSGLEEGAGIGAFDVVKCAGAEEDGTPIGKKLCYRCKNGSRPQVMIFTRSSDAKIVDMLKKLDTQVAKNEDVQLRAFVNMLGDSKDAAGDEVKKLAAATKAKQIPFVVPVEYENGPEDYGINPKAELTIIFANESRVVANYSVASVDELKIDDVMGNLKKILN